SSPTLPRPPMSTPFPYTTLFRSCLAHLRAPPLLFGRRPPQSNYPPHSVLVPDNGTELELQACQGGISRLAPWELASPLQSLPPIDRKSTRLNSSHVKISYAVFCL